MSTTRTVTVTRDGHDTQVEIIQVGSIWIPSLIAGGLYRYIFHGIRPGSFSAAVLVDDLRGAVENGDPGALHYMADIWRVLYSYAPASCRRSRQSVTEWVGGERGGLTDEQLHRTFGRYWEGVDDE